MSSPHPPASNPLQHNTDSENALSTGHGLSVSSIFIAALFLYLLWVVSARIIDQPILPPPNLVITAFLLEIRDELGVHFLVSLYRVICSIFLAILLAGPAGLLLGQYPRLNQLFAPVIYLIYPIPKVVLVPVVLLLLGVGDLPKIIIMTMILFFQILVLVRDAASNIRPELILSVRSLGAGRRALLRYVYLPASIPAILTSIRQSIGTAVAVLYIAELFATKYGLGYYIYYQGSTLFNYPKMYAGIVAMGLLGFSLYFCVDAIERRICHWCGDRT
ncbi:MAG: ABC transporter permease subunit [Anaerolineales bacterium]|nr:MAG: ABC transporter permease subunit [Anaerolineales bacterium]